MMATGASDIDDVDRAFQIIKRYNKKIILMQCNTNYTGDIENLNYINLNVLDTFKKKYGNSIILGLSDHTAGNLSVLGAVAKGARVIEKHFTDNNKRKGPDHHFAMNPKSWYEMVKATRDLELMLGNGIKKIEKNELNAKIVQQRSIRAKHDILKGKFIKKTDLICLRPKSKIGLEPYKISKIIGKKVLKKINKSEEINWKKIK
jgi:N-acetylneuraminate synthase